MLCGVSFGQEGAAGEAEVGFQQYYLAMQSQRVSNISGLTLNYRQAIPDVGVLSVGFSPALSNNSFRTGDDFVRLSDLPWKGQYWRIGVGDFRVSSAVVPMSFANIYLPQIAGRGISVEASHGGRTLGFFYGSGTLTNTPRVVLLLAIPQTIAGFYARQAVGSRLVLGARYMHFSNDLAALRKTPYIGSQTLNLTSASVLSADASYKIAKPLVLFAETEWSAADMEKPAASTRSVPFSVIAGPVLDTPALTVRANYILESSSYFPLIGYYLGDRRGPFGEFRVRPVKRIEVYGSASRYENNVARDVTLPTFRSLTESAGATVRLPGDINLLGQLTLLDLDTRQNGASSWQRATNRQRSVMLTRSIHGHSLRLTARDFVLQSAIGPQRQRSESIEDIFHAKRLIFGGGIKLQHFDATDSRTSLYYHGLAQVQIKRLALHADVESGKDLQNRTLFATNAIGTTIVGASVSLNREWTFEAEAYRNYLTTELNPQSIFVLQGQGVSLPGTLATLNQWSLYFSVTRRLHWGSAGRSVDLMRSEVRQTSLKGSVDGFVREEEGRGDLGVEGIVVMLDQGRSVTSDSAGHFHFAEVPEGVHRIGLSMEELLADFDPGPHKEGAVAVAPGKAARADLEVIRLATIHGQLNGPQDASLDTVVIRLAGSGRYTTPDAKGNFNFYNVRQGRYTVAIDEKTLPQYAALTSPATVEVAVNSATPAAVRFQFEIRLPDKPVRRIVIKQAEAVSTPPLPRVEAQPPLEAAQKPSTPPVAPEKHAAVEVQTIQSHATAGTPRVLQAVQAGRGFTQQGQYAKALIQLTEALRLDPDYAQAYNARGFVYYLQRNYGAAVDDFNAAIRLNPNYANAYELRGLARKATGDPAGGKTDRDRAAQLSR
jgi:hypothetical protein